MTPLLEQLHKKAKQCAARYRSSETELLDVLIEIENLRGYLPLGFSSLFQYCVGYLELTESQSYAFMSIARKSQEVPELKDAVQNQEISFSNARKLVSVITSDNKESWLQKGKSLSQKALEREIVKANPNPPVLERLRPVSEDESELRVGIDRETEENLKRVKAILGTASSKEVLNTVLKDFLKRHDPVQKAKRAKPVQLGARPVAKRYIPRPVFHEVQRRDQGKCQFKGPNGVACGQAYWTEVHHLEPWAFGGKHEAQNLITLCSAHHKYWHVAQGHRAEGRASQRCTTPPQIRNFSCC